MIRGLPWISNCFSITNAQRRLWAHEMPVGADERQQTAKTPFSMTRTKIVSQALTDSDITGSIYSDFGLMRRRNTNIYLHFTCSFSHIVRAVIPWLSTVNATTGDGGTACLSTAMLTQLYHHLNADVSPREVPLHNIMNTTIIATYSVHHNLSHRKPPFRTQARCLLPLFDPRSLSRATHQLRARLYTNFHHC